MKRKKKTEKKDTVKKKTKKNKTVEKNIIRCEKVSMLVY